MPANFGRCTQRICLHFAPRLGLTPSQALGMGTAFGSGMGHAETCGCVTGALLVLGLHHRPDTEDDADKKRDLLQERVAVFEERFLEKQPSLICREILGMDIALPEGMKAAADTGVLSRVCGPLINETCAILEDMLKTEP